MHTLHSSSEKNARKEEKVKQNPLAGYQIRKFSYRSLPLFNLIVCEKSPLTRNQNTLLASLARSHTRNFPIFSGVEL